MKICSVAGCKKEHKAKSFCEKHYRRFRSTGDPERLKRAKKGEPINWIKRHVKHRQEDCLLWPFKKTNKGYGQVGYKGKTVGAHRLMCMLAHGEPSNNKMVAAHTCGQGQNGCVNPAHLRWATAIENEADKKLHGTWGRGAGKLKSVLREVDVLSIHDLSKKHSQQEISKLYGISSSSVGRILRGEVWPDVKQRFNSATE